MASMQSSKARGALSRAALTKLAQGGPVGPQRAITGTWGHEAGSVLVGTIIEREEQEPLRQATANKSRVVYVEGALYFGRAVTSPNGEEVIYAAGEIIEGVFQWRLTAASALVFFFPAGAFLRAEVNGLVEIGDGKTRIDFASITTGPIDATEDDDPPPKPAATKKATPATPAKDTPRA